MISCYDPHTYFRPGLFVFTSNSNTLLLTTPISPTLVAALKLLITSGCRMLSLSATRNSSALLHTTTAFSVQLFSSSILRTPASAHHHRPNPRSRLTRCRAERPP